MTSDRHSLLTPDPRQSYLELTEGLDWSGGQGFRDQEKAKKAQQASSHPKMMRKPMMMDSRDHFRD
jgi:hypothetical protein